jgi:hypothetical protein
MYVHPKHLGTDEQFMFHQTEARFDPGSIWLCNLIDRHPSTSPLTARHGRQNGLLTSSAIDDQQVPISCSSRSLRAASVRRKRARARQIRTIAGIFRTGASNQFIDVPD